MQLRNGKKLALLETSLPTNSTKEIEDPVKKFRSECQSLLYEVEKYYDNEYTHICILKELYEYIYDHYDQYKQFASLDKVFEATRESCLRLLSQCGSSAMNHGGKDPEFLKGLNELAIILLALSAKLGPRTLKT